MNDWSDLQYIAIVGVGRSGTSLLMSMLNAHPDVAFPPEFHFINRHLAQKPQAALDEAVARLQADARFARLEMDLAEVIRPFTHNRQPFTMPALYRQILLTYAQQQNVAIIGDKAPKYVEYLPVIRQIVPDAKIIHLIRDPRDVYLSRTKAAWSANRSDTTQFLAYRAQYALGRSQGPRLFGENYLEVQYENLLAQPEMTLHSICDLLQIPYFSQMLAFATSAQELVAQDELAWKKETFGPLLINNMNKWQRELTPAQTARVEAACRPAFTDGLYQAARPYPTFSGRLTNGYMSLLSRLYRGRVIYKNRQICRRL
ncbi:MAG: sulfotransferase [Chloroflexi bacterium]|nr:sulfotransferase [Chloroflexota bacterium]